MITTLSRVVMDLFLRVGERSTPFARWQAVLICMLFRACVSVRLFTLADLQRMTRAGARHRMAVFYEH